MRHMSLQFICIGTAAFVKWSHFGVNFPIMYQWYKQTNVEWENG
jgi:hypothetical protein